MSADESRLQQTDPTCLRGIPPLATDMRNSWIAAITTRWHLWAGNAISVVLLLFFYLQLEPGEVKTLLAEASYVYLIPSVALYFVGVYFRAYRWRASWPP